VKGRAERRRDERKNGWHGHVQHSIDNKTKYGKREETRPREDLEGKQDGKTEANSGCPKVRERRRYGERQATDREGKTPRIKGGRKLNQILARVGRAWAESKKKALKTKDINFKTVERTELVNTV